MLWIHPLDSLVDQPLSGTEDATSPFWSPDSRWIGFFAQGKLKKIDVENRGTITVCDAPAAYGGTWNKEDVILIASQGLHRVPAIGGEATPLAKAENPGGPGSDRWPYFLPDGHHFLYSVIGGGRDSDGIYVGDLSGGIRRISGGRSAAAYSSGYLLSTRDRTLLAQPFDPNRAKFTGDARPIRYAENIEKAADDLSSFSASQNGVLVYWFGGASRKKLLWLDRMGKVIGEIKAEGDLRQFSLSPDGRLLAVAIRDAQTQTSDVWIIDPARNTQSRFTFDPADDHSPLWSPDGGEIVFLSNRDKANGIYRKAANGAGQETLLLRSQRPLDLESWSPDGRLLLYRQTNATSDILAVPAVGDGKPLPILQTSFEERAGRISPDGRWIAYESNESGRFEVFIQSFPPAPLSAHKWQVSNEGGMNPEWRRDGGELFYTSPEGKLMAVQIQGRPQDLDLGRPLPLFPIASEAYQAAPDGRFLILMSVAEERSNPIQFVINWENEIQQR